MFVAIGLGVLIGVFYLTNSATPGSGTDTSGITERVIELKVENGKVVGGAKVLKAKEGDRVTIRVATDKDDELHLHGYDLFTNLSSGSQAEISFVANQTGRFEFELENSKINLGAVEVSPQ